MSHHSVADVTTLQVVESTSSTLYCDDSVDDADEEIKMIVERGRTKVLQMEEEEVVAAASAGNETGFDFFAISGSAFKGHYHQCDQIER